MIKIQASISKGWLHNQGGFVFNQKYYLDPYYRMKQDEACHSFIKEKFPDYPIYNMEDNLVQAEYVVPNMMLVGAIQPNMIIAAALGAEFVFASDKDSDVKGFPLKDLKDVSELQSVADVLRLSFIKRLEEQYVIACEKYPNCRIIPPFFWDISGRATIHGIITTSMKFIGQDIFTKMMMEPELVKSIHAWITEVYIHVVKYFSKLGNLPITSVHVGECSGTMLDEESYREFVTPFISQLGREFGEVRLHSCGNADHVISPICEIENLKIIDTGSNTSLAKIRQKMGKDFEINVFPPVEVFVEGSKPESIQQWLAQTLKDNDGGNLKIEYHLEPDYNLSNCLYIHEELSRLGIVKKERLY
jgi:uroporphyrinogen-III decarboxylase